MSNTPNPFDGLQVESSGNEPLPPASYFAIFNGVEAFSNDKVSDKFRWSFVVVSGPHKDRHATALTDRRLTPHTHAGRLISGLVGRPLIPGEDMGVLWQSLQGCKGKKYLVTVASGPKGGKPSVQNVSLPPDM